MKRYYQCNDKAFDNYFKGLAYSSENQSFLNYSINDTAIKSYTDVIPHQLKSTDALAREKLSKLRDENDKIHLHYTGGTDSHTILKLADQMGIEFDLITTDTNSAYGSEYVDRDYVYAMNYCQGRKNYKINAPSLEDYSIYDDSEWYMKHTGAVFMFRPNFPGQWMTKENFTGYKSITGLSKPFFYVDKNHNYFWVLTDSQVNEYFHFDTCHFFSDEEYAEYAVSQVYTAKNFLESSKLTGWVNTENICSRGFTLDEKKQFNWALGRILPDDPLMISAALSKNSASYLNAKALRAMTELCERGHNGIISKFFHSVEHMKSKFRNQNHALEIANEQATRCIRIAAVFHVTDDGLNTVSSDNHPWKENV